MVRKNPSTARRPIALAAVAALSLGSLFFTQPAFADEAPTRDQTASDAPPVATLDAVDRAEDSGADIVAFGVNAVGEDVVVVAENGLSASKRAAAVDEFAAATGAEDARIVTVGAAPVAFAATDIVGGQGYLGLDSGDQAHACSIGFALWSPAGKPALLSAGHCAPLTNLMLSMPSQDPAVGGPGFTVLNGTPVLGKFGFYQFGSIGNTAGAAGDLAATDISVIDLDVAANYTPLPAVTDWTTAGDTTDSLTASAVSVTATGAPVVGAISKSGRTTGFTTGYRYVGDIVDGWANISGKWVRGFSSNVLAAPGDSGGSVIQGHTAVGVISGGVAAQPGIDQWTWAVSLVHALPMTGGYEVALHIDAPVMVPASGSGVAPGTVITGTAPGATEVVISGVGVEFTVPVTSDAFSFTSPAAAGDYDYTLTAVNGFNKSSATNYALTVQAVAPAAPAITSITDGDSFAHDAGPSGLSGTGTTGATVTVKLIGSTMTYATLVRDGSWTIFFNEPLAPGSYQYSVTQMLDGVTSAETFVAFSVKSAPAPEDGTDQGGNAGGGVAPSNPGAETDGTASDPLAKTGAGSFAPTLGAASALVLLSAGVVLIVARRRAHN